MSYIYGQGTTDTVIFVFRNIGSLENGIKVAVTLGRLEGSAEDLARYLIRTYHEQASECYIGKLDVILH
jgi:hypothetical protein